MKVWVTKYSLTDGILEYDTENGDHVEVCQLADPKRNMIRVTANINNLRSFYFHGKGKEWHETKESAVAKAESMRLKKIESLNKQITKLENLSFNTTHE